MATPIVENNTPKRIWDKLTGDRNNFSMENRAFNYVSIISFAVIIYCFTIDMYIGQYIMGGVLVGLFFVLSILYYQSRVKKQYKLGIVIYAVCSYIAIFLNYFYNSGIIGPTLFMFFLVFHFLVTISGRCINKLWIALHMCIPAVLLGAEYLHPEWVPDAYTSRFSRFVDVYTTYIAVVVFVFFVTNYLRQYYMREKKLAEQRALSIFEQNEQIVLQNKQLAQINEEKNKLFSIVSHDLKSPIDSISGYLEVLTNDLVAPEERLEIETELLNQTKYTSELLLNLLYWSRTQMNGVNVDLKPIPLMEIVDDARNYKIATAAKKGVKLTYNAANDIEVIADTEMLRIVLRNIVNNAIKFTNPGGEIIIAVAKNAGTAEILIKDTGIGIPLDRQGQIFTLQTSSTYGTKDEKGIGLGLMLCKEFVEYMKGTIWFESEVGKGSVFHISLPLSRL